MLLRNGMRLVTLADTLRPNDRDQTRSARAIHPKTPSTDGVGFLPLAIGHAGAARQHRPERGGPGALALYIGLRPQC
jgi:hypothetical protein